MSQFDRFDEMLATAPSDDGWGDDIVLLAAELLKTFQSEDWDKLGGIWCDRTQKWQGFAADVLSDGASDRAVPLLLEMIRLGIEPVKRGACDSLRVMLQGQPERLQVPADIRAIIDRLLSKSSGLMKESLCRLQEYVTSDRS